MNCEAVVAVDESGNVGRISNIVPVYVDEPPPPPPPTAPPFGGSDGLEGAEGGGGWRHPYGANGTVPVQHEGGGLSEHQLYAVAGGVAGFVLLLLVLSVAACLTRKQRRKPEKSSAPMHGITITPNSLISMVLYCRWFSHFLSMV